MLSVGCGACGKGAPDLKRLWSLTASALMIALSVVLTRFASVRVAIGGVEGVRLGLGALPNVLAGIVFGPLYGAAAGGIADVLGFMLSPMGGYMPHFTLTAALTGAIPGLVFRLLQPRQRGPAKVLPLGLSIAAGTVIVSWGLTPYFLHTLFGLDYRLILTPRIVQGLIEVPVYTLAVKAVYDRVARLVRA